ncbi:MAG TPA: Holliday junction branch migration protein RuvA [Anaerolineaceae bacterium]|nr:Holliday junction branch migration protein RuvA [Anaerolineaceae bacterium]
MISSISGKIQYATNDALIVDVHGIGFEVFTPKHLLLESQQGESIFLYTYLVVREDLLALYGFQTSEEKHFFLLFLGVEGIGPKLAMAVISNLSLDAIRRAVVSEQADVFSRVPGIGKKTAQKILIQLQGKVGTAEDGSEIRTGTPVDDQVLEALTGLGYSIVEAQSAIQALPKDIPDDVEEKLRTALQYFSH